MHVLSSNIRRVAQDGYRARLLFAQVELPVSERASRSDQKSGELVLLAACQPRETGSRM